MDNNGGFAEFVTKFHKNKKSLMFSMILKQYNALKLKSQYDESKNM